MSSHIERLGKKRNATPGRLADIARKRSGRTLLVLLALVIISSGLMLAGIDVPGRAWIIRQ